MAEPIKVLLEDETFLSNAPGIVLKQQIASNQALQLILQTFAAILLGKATDANDVDHLITASQHLSNLNKHYLKAAGERGIINK